MHSVSLQAVSAGQVQRFLDRLASLTGFVAMGTPHPADSGARCAWFAAEPIGLLRFPDSGRDAVSRTMHEALAGLDPAARIAGIIDYDAVYGLEAALRNGRTPGSRQPVRAAIYSWWVELTSSGVLLWLTEDAPAETRARVEAIFSAAEQANPSPASHFMASEFSPDTSRRSYLNAIRRVQEYILSGDCYQVNLSHRFQAHYNGSLWHAYSALCEQFPSPHSGYLALGAETVLSISPESFLEIEDGCIRTKPIKGTRPRATPESLDQAQAQALLASAKDRAENVMIVDLLRNDLGRFSETGSVRVEALAALESYVNVHHLVSTVSAQLRPDVHPFDAFLGCFPGGSITGAPKIRAMEIIAELEATPRSAYCGSLFWLNGKGKLYSNIAIRTFYGKDGQLYCHGGGGIVADSDPEAEYQETLDKVGPLMKALTRMGLG